MTTVEQLLPGYEPSEADMVRYAMEMPLKAKIEKAILLMQTAEMMARQTGKPLYIADSFGKDSSCIVHLAKLAGVQHECWHNITTIDPPELIMFGRKHREGTKYNRQPEHMLTYLARTSAGVPTRMNRWCCNRYKEQGGAGGVKVIGVRVEESSRRAKRWKQIVPDRNNKAGSYICPIVYWTTEDVWEFHRQESLPHCCLYDEGFTRLGCIGCPMGGANQQEKQFKRWPRYAEAWMRSVKRHFEKWKGVPTVRGEERAIERFDSWQEMWAWWISGKAAEGGTGCQMEFLFT